MIVISKAILSTETAQHLRKLVGNLEPAPLRDLALELAAQPGLRVSVITYEDGTAELEVLDVGPPCHDERTIDCRRYTRPDPPSQPRILSLAGQSGLRDTVDLIRAAMRDVGRP